MDKLFANLTGNKADDKDSKKKDASWQGGRSDMDSIKNKNSTVNNNNNNSDNNKNNNNNKGTPKNFLANANSALQKIDLFKPSKQPSKQTGRSLGGTQPGRLLSISLPHPGPLGIEIEKRRNASQSAIVSHVVPQSQADVAGLARGDVLCRLDADGAEFSYPEFLKLAKSNVRPLRFQVRRVESSSLHGEGSVDALQRKQAVVAAAEAREARHRALLNKTSKPSVPSVSGRPISNDSTPANNNIETIKAIQAVKAAEQSDAETLGYNPYEARAMTSGQARNAAVVMTRGEMNVENAPSKLRVAPAVAPGEVGAPRDTTVVVPSEFETAFSTLVTSSPDGAAVQKSLSIMRKLISNAVTKGQRSHGDDDDDDEARAKFRRVRLSNPKIKEAITDVHGALELMMAVGFVLSENEADGETYLVLPPGEEVEEWIGVALRRMEEYELGGCS